MSWSPKLKDIRRPGRNEMCPCGSGRKFKVCCWRLDQIARIDRYEKPHERLDPIDIVPDPFYMMNKELIDGDHIERTDGD